MPMKHQASYTDRPVAFTTDVARRWTSPVPVDMFERIGNSSSRPPLPSVYEAHKPNDQPPKWDDSQPVKADFIVLCYLVLRSICCFLSPLINARLSNGSSVFPFLKIAILGHLSFAVALVAIQD